MINWRTADEKPRVGERILVLVSDKDKCIFLNYISDHSMVYFSEKNIRKWCYESDLIKDAENDVCEYSYNYSQDRFEYSCGLVLPKVIGNPDYCSNCGKWLRRKRA